MYKLKRSSNLLYFVLEIPFISISTSAMRYCHSVCEYEYLAFHIKIHKWQFGFSYGVPFSILRQIKADNERGLKTIKFKCYRCGKKRKEKMYMDGLKRELINNKTMTCVECHINHRKLDRV